ncbi:MAG: hypothetical protein WBP41_11380 [Saprospiraceae bacterium]
MKKLLTLVIAISILSSCASWKSINLFNLKIGMTKSEVVQAIGKNPDNLIGAKQYPDGTVEVLQYSRRGVWYGELQEMYWLYFFNDKLIQWGRPGDWQREADRIYEIRNR